MSPLFMMIPGVPQRVAPFSHAVVADGWVFVTEGVEAQTRRMMNNLILVLAGIGLDMSHVVMARVYLTEFARDYPVMNAAYASYFPADRRPVRTCVGVTRLAREVPLEIDLVAKRP